MTTTPRKSVVKKIISEILFGKLTRSFAEMLTQLTNGTDIKFYFSSMSPKQLEIVFKIEPISKVPCPVAIFPRKSPKTMSILLKKLRKCSIIDLNLQIQGKDGNMSTLFDVWNTIQKKISEEIEFWNYSYEKD